MKSTETQNILIIPHTHAHARTLENKTNQLEILEMKRINRRVSHPKLAEKTSHCAQISLEPEHLF